MGFWELSDGDSAKDTGADYDTGNGDQGPIPNGSWVVAEITDAKWHAFDDGARFVDLFWKVEQPSDYAGRRQAQKLWVDDLSPNVLSKENGEVKAVRKRDKDRRLLAAIDANAKGKLIKTEDFDSDDLAVALVGAQMGIKMMVIAGDRGELNFIAAVRPAKQGHEIAPDKAPRPARKPAAGAKPTPPGRDFDDEIPF